MTSSSILSLARCRSPVFQEKRAEMVTGPGLGMSTDIFKGWAGSSPGKTCSYRKHLKAVPTCSCSMK